MASIDPLLHRTTTTFDAASRPIRIQDANANITTTIFDAAGRARRPSTPTASGRRKSLMRRAAAWPWSMPTATATASSTTPIAARRSSSIHWAHRVTYGFDAASRQTLRIDARGFRTSYVYDNDNRVYRPALSRWDAGYVRLRQGQPPYAAERLDRAARPRRSTPTGRLSAVINPAALRLTYAYDAASQRKYLVEPKGARFTYSFDAAGRTNYVANPQAQRATWSYDAASRVTGIHYANTTRTSYLYDNASRLLRVANLSSTSTTLSSFSYALDAVGNRLRVVESSGNRVTWSYDKTYQLKNEQRSGSNSYNITYTYRSFAATKHLVRGELRLAA